MNRLGKVGNGETWGHRLQDLIYSCFFLRHHHRDGTDSTVCLSPSDSSFVPYLSLLLLQTNKLFFLGFTMEPL